MNLFKIPVAEGKLSATQVVSVIDCSGSMSSWWKWVAEFYNQAITKTKDTITITFDTRAKRVDDNTLNTNINHHGGGGTAIPEAFQLMETLIEKVPKSQPLTVLFISDGQDNNMGSLEQRLGKLKGNTGHYMNFICLGIQSGFPTVLSMKLRDLYHRGDPTVPAIYLIEYASEKAFFNKFSTMSQFFLSKSLLDVIPPVRAYPWEEPSEEVYESSWVLCEEPFVIINDVKHLVKDEDITIEDLVDIFRGWSQKLQLISLDPKEKKFTLEYAKKTASELKRIVSIFEKQNNIQLLKKEHVENPSFYEKVKNFISSKIGSRVVWFLEEIENLETGRNLAEMGEYDAAKRIQLGTITGRYQQKILALTKNTPAVYQSYRNEFLKTYRSLLEGPLKGLIKPKTGQYKQTSDVYYEENFAEAVELTKNIFDLLEVFPLCGLAIQVKRFEKTVYNPWKIEIKEVSEEFISLQDLISADHCLKKKDISGKEHTYNCLLPIFGKSDQPLAPLLKENFFRLMMTFNVQNEPDTFSRDALLSLLSEVLIHACRFTQLPKNLLPSVIQTILIVYAEDEEFQEFESALLKNHEVLWAKEILPETEEDQIFLRKLLTHLICLKSNGLDVQKLETLLFFGFQVCLYQSFIKQNISTLDFYSPTKIAEQESKGLSPESLLQRFLYFKDLARNTTKLATETIKIGDFSDFSFNCEELKNKINSRINLNTLERMCKILNVRIPNDDELLSWLICIEDSKVQKKHPEFRNLTKDEINFKALELIKHNTPTFIQKMEKGIFKKIKHNFQNEFYKTHFGVLPMTVEEIKKECESRQIPFNKIEFRESGLPKNVCTAPKCPHFLKDIGSELLRKHLNTWGKKIPGGYHLTIKNHYKSPNVTETVIEKLGLSNQDSLSRFKVEYPFVEKYTKEVGDKYKLINE